MAELSLKELQQLKARGVLDEKEFELRKKGLALRTLRRERRSYYFGRSGIIYILLAAFLGAIGIHNFYAGRWKTALTQLLLGVFSSLFLYLPLIVTSLWSLSDIFFVNKDGKGLRFKGSQAVILGLRILVTLVFTIAVYLTQFVDFSMPLDFNDDVDLSSVVDRG